jgi:phosphatidylglycerol:prolipoprotein diacylglycerol transferase
VNAFSLLIAAGVGLGLGWTAARTSARLALETVDSGLVVLLGALVGGRLGYAAAHWTYFRLQPAEIFRVWQGGLSGSGALVGAALALLLAAWAFHQHPGRLADRLLPLGTALVAAGWLACWVSGAGYGGETNAWWGLPSADEQGLYAQRVPVQALGALAALAWFALLDAGQERLARLPAGSSAAAWLLGTALCLFGLSFLRADPTRLLDGLRLDAWGALGAALLAVIGLAGAWLARQR